MSSVTSAEIYIYIYILLLSREVDWDLSLQIFLTFMSHENPSKVGLFTTIRSIWATFRYSELSEREKKLIWCILELLLTPKIIWNVFALLSKTEQRKSGSPWISELQQTSHMCSVGQYSLKHEANLDLRASRWLESNCFLFFVCTRLLCLIVLGTHYCN